MVLLFIYLLLVELLSLNMKVASSHTDKDLMRERKDDENIESWIRAACALIQVSGPKCLILASISAMFKSNLYRLDKTKSVNRSLSIVSFKINSKLVFLLTNFTKAVQIGPRRVHKTLLLCKKSAERSYSLCETVYNHLKCKLTEIWTGNKSQIRKWINKYSRQLKCDSVILQRILYKYQCKVFRIPKNADDSQKSQQRSIKINEPHILF